MLPPSGAIVATAGGPDKFVKQLVAAKALTVLTPARYRAGFHSGYAVVSNLYRKKPSDAKPCAVRFTSALNSA